MGTPSDTLARVIAQVESSQNQYALRFEPRVHQSLVEQLLGQTSPEVGRLLRFIAQANICSMPTAEVIYSTSYGAYQVMGHELYEQGWIKSIGFYVSNSVAQFMSFTRYLQVKNLPFTWDELKNNQSALEHFATEYNGPANPDFYAHRMLEAAKQLGV